MPEQQRYCRSGECCGGKVEQLAGVPIEEDAGDDDAGQGGEAVHEQHQIRRDAGVGHAEVGAT